MTRKQEIDEFIKLLNTLCKKYDVQLGLNIIDLKDQLNDDKRSNE